MIKAVIFDFDGVILESVDIKTRAFAELFKDYPEHLEEVVRLHVENGGMSRFRKFEIIYETMLKKPLPDEEMIKLGEKFSQLVFDEVLKAPFVKGAEEFLELNVGRYMMFVVSGTPDGEIKEIVKIRGLSRFFKEVLGTPASKGENILSILAKYRISTDETMFVGDAMADYEGAKHANVGFIGRVTNGVFNPFESLNLNYVIRDLTELDYKLSTVSIQQKQTN